MRDKSRIIGHVKNLLSGLGIDMTDPNFIDTPRRVAEWFLEFTQTKEDLEQDCEDFAKAVFPHKRKDMIVSSPFTVYSMCPHHFLPVEYNVIIGYIPNGHVVGLSKLVRITAAVAKWPELQEEFTPFLADLLVKHLKTDNVAVTARGTHSCMTIRGVRNGPTFANTALRGVIDTDPKVRQEYYDLAGFAKRR